MSNALKIILIILLSIIAIALIGILTILIMRGDKFDFKLGMGLSNNLIEEKTIEDIKDINIDVNYVDVFIEPVDDEKINIKLYSDDNENHSIKSEDTINVVFKEKKKVFNLFKKSPRMVISIPKEYDKTIYIKGDVLDVKGSGSDHLILNCDFRVGDVKVDDMDKASIKLETGDVKLNKVNDLKVNLKTGDVKIKEINNSLDIKGNVGDVKLEKINLNVSSKIELSTGDVKIGQTNAIYIDGKTDVGDVKINTNHRLSDVELIIRNHIGDIKVG